MERLGKRKRRCTMGWVLSTLEDSRPATREGHMDAWLHEHRARGIDLVPCLLHLHFDVLNKSTKTTTDKSGPITSFGRSDDITCSVHIASSPAARCLSALVAGS